MRGSAKCLVAVLVAVAIGAPTAPAGAVLCTMDNVPAALLLPYFAVSVAPFPARPVDTVFSITNTSTETAFAHLRLFSDWGLPTIVFAVELAALGSVTISLSDVINNGNLPPSATLCDPLSPLADGALSPGELRQDE